MRSLKSALAALPLALISIPTVAEDIKNPVHVMATQTVQVGPLTLSDFRARATLPNQPVAGAFLTIQNTSDSADTLVGVETDIAERSEIHEMAMEGDTMKMRPLPDGLALPAMGAIQLKPGGYHLMFMGLKKPLVAGTVINVTLTFEQAGTVTLPFNVVDMTSKQSHRAEQ